MKINYREKWEKAEVEKLELVNKNQELQFKIQAVLKILAEKEEE